ncbi:multiple epidermal growth factor-like domains protein 11 [Nematostella vectensis]|uniref:multiple epidermal growth factor-like domains protein 11 n=1 Tax=Nematostella vectensis TaxID=45351 RepID=UPI0013900F84|nr:multiple epidermal growth factor-like domains protein 11 [Nematostella vectensis]
MTARTQKVVAVALILAALPLSQAWWGLFECDPDVEGGGCSVFCPCEDGMTCEAGVHRCRRPGGVGNSCHATKPCRAGLSCEAGSHVCRAPGVTGDPCHATRPCGSGFFCQSLVQKCQRYARLNEACYPESLEHLGSRCDKDNGHWCDPVTRTCVTASEEGGPCGNMGGREDEGRCESDLKCECDDSCNLEETLKCAKGQDHKTTLQQWVKSGNYFCCTCAEN